VTWGNRQVLPLQNWLLHLLHVLSHDLVPGGKPRLAAWYGDRVWLLTYRLDHSCMRPLPSPCLSFFLCEMWS
jgi:hypothetical protein